MRSFATIALLALALAACGGQSTSDSGGATGGSAGAATGGGAGAATGGGAGASGNVGGSTSAGGAGGAGGGAAGAGGGACVSSTVTFQLEAASGSWCLGQTCTTEWVSIRDASGNPVSRSDICQVSCDTCTRTLCPPVFCALPSPMPAAGATETWDGTFFGSRTCGASGMSCVAKECARPAKFTAVMCATPNPSPDSGTGCAGVNGAKQTCVEVPFDYPPAAAVVGTLPGP